MAHLDIFAKKKYLIFFSHIFQKVLGKYLRFFFARIQEKVYFFCLSRMLFHKLVIKGALKAHKHISLYESYTLQIQDATILFAYCHPPRQPLPATGCGHVFQVLSAVTQSGGRDHILSPSYLWAVYLTAVLLTRALCTSCIKTYISNKKMVKSCAAIGCKKRR